MECRGNGKRKEATQRTQRPEHRGHGESGVRSECVFAAARRARGENLDVSEWNAAVTAREKKQHREHRGRSTEGTENRESDRNAFSLLQGGLAGKILMYPNGMPR